MSEPTVFPAPAIEVRLNGRLLGMTQSFRTRVVTVPIAVHAFGKRDASAIAEGQRDYTVTLRRLIVDSAALPNQPSASGFGEFSLSLSDGTLETTFMGCRVIKESTLCEAGKLTVEELEIRAMGRTWSNLA